MKPDRLLCLYPRAWRERYGDEFLALVGDRPVRLPQLIDIVSGAIDAHVSSDIRAMTSRGHVTHLQGGTAVMEALKQSCIHDRPAIISRRDAWTGAGVMVGGSLLMSVFGIGLDRAGFDTFGEAVKAAAFPVSMLLSMPFTFIKGKSWKAQGVLVGIPLAIVVLLTYIATRL